MATLTTAESWPDILMREQSLKWSLRHRTESSEPTLDGTIQVRSTLGGGLWAGFFNTVFLKTKEQKLTWQALEASLDGGMTPVDVPVMLCDQPPWPLTAGGDPIMSVEDVPHSDDTPFSDDAFYAGSVIWIETVGATAARAVAMRVKTRYSGTLLAGVHFSIYHATYGWRLYRIAKVFPVEGFSDRFDIQFRPTLREAVADVTRLEFDRPRCVMTLASDDAMDVEYELRKRGFPSVAFVEAGA